MIVYLKKFNPMIFFKRIDYCKYSNSLFFVMFAFLLTACASAPPFEERAEGLIGLDEKELLACSGLPNASFTMKDGVQILVYSIRKSEIEDYGFGFYRGYRGGCSPYYGSYANRCSPFGIAGDLEVRERSCQVGYWIKDGKITNIVGENTVGGHGLCGQILNRCLKPVEHAEELASAGRAENKAYKPSY